MYFQPEENHQTRIAKAKKLKKLQVQTRDENYFFFFSFLH